MFPPRLPRFALRGIRGAAPPVADPRLPLAPHKRSLASHAEHRQHPQSATVDVCRGRPQSPRGPPEPTPLSGRPPRETRARRNSGDWSLSRIRHRMSGHSCGLRQRLQRVRVSIGRFYLDRTRDHACELVPTADIREITVPSSRMSKSRDRWIQFFANGIDQLVQRGVVGLLTCPDPARTNLRDFAQVAPHRRLGSTGEKICPPSVGTIRTRQTVAAPSYTVG